MKSVRTADRTYSLALWVLSIILAGFIIGLGDLVIGDLPHVERSLSPDQFVDSAAMTRIDREQAQLTTRRGALDDQLEIARLQLDQAQKASKNATETFQAWIQTRTATTNPNEDPEVIARTRALVSLKANERSIQSRIGDLEKEQTTLNQRRSALYNERVKLRDASEPAYQKALFWQELRIFLLRLAITLPMLLLASWMVVKKRKSDHWPLLRGFVLAAVFVFFVELVPYLPSYGGYVRYGVGILLTIAGGHFLIKNMRAYLERRRVVEQQAEEDRRKLVTHDEAFKKMAAKTCPGCDRPIATTEDAEANFCVHCGMTLFDHCRHCHTRKMAFFRYCMTCGTPAEETVEQAT